MPILCAGKTGNCPVSQQAHVYSVPVTPYSYTGIGIGIGIGIRIRIGTSIGIGIGIGIGSCEGKHENSATPHHH